MSNRPQPALDRAAPAREDARLARNSLTLRLQPRTVCGDVVRAGGQAGGRGMVTQWWVWRKRGLQDATAILEGDVPQELLVTGPNEQGRHTILEREKYGSGALFRLGRDKNAVIMMQGPSGFPEVYARMTSDGTIKGTIIEMWGWVPPQKLGK